MSKSLRNWGVSPLKARKSTMGLSCPECLGINCSTFGGWSQNIVGFSVNPPISILNEETEKYSPCVIVECPKCLKPFWFHIPGDGTEYAEHCQNWPEEK